MESDGLGLYFSLLHVDLVAAEDYGHLLADTDKVTWSRLNVCYPVNSIWTYDASLERSCM